MNVTSYSKQNGHCQIFVINTNYFNMNKIGKQTNMMSFIEKRIKVLWCSNKIVMSNGIISYCFLYFFLFYYRMKILNVKYI